MLVFFSNRLGCLGSIFVSIAVSAILLAVCSQAGGGGGDF